MSDNPDFVLRCRLAVLYKNWDEKHVSAASSPLHFVVTHDQIAQPYGPHMFVHVRCSSDLSLRLFYGSIAFSKTSCPQLCVCVYERERERERGGHHGFINRPDRKHAALIPIIPIDRLYHDRKDEIDSADERGPLSLIPSKCLKFAFSESKFRWNEMNKHGWHDADKIAVLSHFVQDLQIC